MHRILKETHAKGNIELLKARDVFFDRARRQNNCYRAFCLMAPIVLSLTGTIFIVISHLYPNIKVVSSAGEFFDHYLEIIVGIVALIAFIVDCKIAVKISDNLSHSNRLRELYDCKVLRIKENHFLYCDLDSTVEQDLRLACQRADSPKYEVWYRETFSDNEFANAVCAMMDNIIYTYYIYADHRKRLGVKLTLYSVTILAYTVFYLFSTHDITSKLINPFILFLAVFDRIKDLVSSYLTSKALEETNKDLKGTVLSLAFEIMTNSDNYDDEKESKQFLLRTLQDVIARNRDNGLFVPKSVRDKYLKNSNAYYRDLDEVKNALWKDASIEKPCRPADYEIPTVEDDSVFVSLETVHKELLDMLLDVKRVLDDAGICFMLDGGTLIGSIREPNHGFLAWDDDVDLSLKESDAEAAMRVIRCELGDKYEVQDCSSEEYYSPRLSRFRVRQKNEISRVNEKDSELYELYHSKGLFLDIYTYCPILINKPVDAVCRRIWFYPLYKKIRRAEANWKYASTQPVEKEVYLRKFSKLKRRFMKRRAKYLRYANCKKHYSYIPGYIENIKEAGPYIKAEHIYSERNIATFENIPFAVPSVPEMVLSAFYGENWNVSPYKSLESIYNGEWYSFSSDTFDATGYKHLKGVSLYRK